MKMQLVEGSNKDIIGARPFQSLISELHLMDIRQVALSFFGEACHNHRQESADKIAAR